MMSLDLSGFSPFARHLSIDKDDAPLLPDTLLWGAGLHAMGRGDHLGLQLDADWHPLTGLERRANAILFVHPHWEKEWGGALHLAGCEPIECKPGRLALFETTDESWHGISELLTCPAEIERRSLAVYWWGIPREPAKRARAYFQPMA